MELHLTRAPALRPSLNLGGLPAEQSPAFYSRLGVALDLGQWGFIESKKMRKGTSKQGAVAHPLDEKDQLRDVLKATEPLAGATSNI